MPLPSQLLFLPGASGSTAFWEPLSDCLTYSGRKRIMGYPGFGSVPADPMISGLDDLVTSALHHIDQPTALIAQSMGGIIAIRIALQRPDLITHLVLTVTSGGIDTESLGATDWRPTFTQANPQLPDWFVSHRTDLSPLLSTIRIPALLLWGDADPISPIAVGHKLLESLPQAELHIIAGGNHDLAHTHARQLAPLIDHHLTK